MNELEHMKLLVDDFIKEANAFIERQKEYQRRLDEIVNMTRQAAANWDNVNNRLNALKHG